jgi:response regulator RpfG family c-di-GMP phosphodiesterase
LKVLIVEEDSQIRDYLSMLLEAGLECEIIEASSGNEAVTIFEFEEDIDLVISEVLMKGGGGHLIVDYLDENNITIPFIWLSHQQNKEVQVVKEVLKRDPLNAFICKPFKDTDFLPIIENVLASLPVKEESQQSDFDEAQAQGNQQERQSHEGIKQSDRRENSSRYEDLYARDKKKALEEGDADWSIGLKRKNIDDEAADYSLKVKNKSQEQEADWDLKNRSEASEQEADWDLKNKGNASEEEADWDLKNKGNASEEEADWDLKNKSEASEEEADWDLKNKSEASEEEADWDLKNKGNASEEEADWDLKNKSEASDQEADWDLKNKSEASEQEADWDLKNKGEASEQEADWSLKKKKASLEDNVEGYKKIKIKRFLNFSTLVCDAYIKLGKAKMVRIIGEGKPYEQELIEKYLDKGIEFLFVEEQDYERFTLQFSDLVSSRLTLAQKFNDEIKSVAELAAFESTRQLAREFGVSEIAAEKVKESVESNLKSLAKKPNLEALLQRILRGGDYISERSLLVSHFAGQICMNTSWSSDETLQKLSMAALMHDIALEENRLAKISSLSKATQLSEEDKRLIKEHPGQAAKIISEGESVFTDVESIIIQHHEKPDQSGFPRGLGSLSISPLSCIFIIASEFAYEVYGKNPSDIDMAAIKEKFNEQFSSGNFKKPLQAFLAAF